MERWFRSMRLRPTVRRCRGIQVPLAQSPSERRSSRKRRVVVLLRRYSSPTPRKAARRFYSTRRAPGSRLRTFARSLMSLAPTGLTTHSLVSRSRPRVFRQFEREPVPERRQLSEFLWHLGRDAARGQHRRVDAASELRRDAYADL